MDKPTAVIVILNWNGLELTKKCLASVHRQTFTKYRVIVVDNGSSDGSQAWLEAQDHLILIKNSSNQGFAQAINQGFSKALMLGAEYVVSLNNDVELDRKWLEVLVTYMSNNSSVGFAQGASMQFEERKHFDSTGIYLERGFIPNQRASGKTTPQLDIPAIGPNAAGAIYQAKMLTAIRHSADEYFDRRFFAYVEDVDFNLRCSARGFVFAYVKDALMFHIGSATGDRIARKKMFWGARNMVWLVYKNAPFAVFRKNARLIIKSHLANLQYLRREQPKNFWPYFWGLTVGVICLPAFLRKRRQNLRLQKITTAQFQALLVPSNPPLRNPLRNLKKLLKYK